MSTQTTTTGRKTERVKKQTNKQKTVVYRDDSVSAFNTVTNRPLPLKPLSHSLSSKDVFLIKTFCWKETAAAGSISRKGHHMTSSFKWHCFPHLDVWQALNTKNKTNILDYFCNLQNHFSSIVHMHSDTQQLHRFL